MKFKCRTINSYVKRCFIYEFVEFFHSNLDNRFSFFITFKIKKSSTLIHVSALTKLEGQILTIYAVYIACN